MTSWRETGQIAKDTARTYFEPVVWFFDKWDKTTPYLVPFMLGMIFAWGLLLYWYPLMMKE